MPVWERDIRVSGWETDRLVWWGVEQIDVTKALEKIDLSGFQPRKKSAVVSGGG